MPGAIPGSCVERYVHGDVKKRKEAAFQAIAMGSHIIKITDKHPPRCPACKRKFDASRISTRKAPRVRVRS